MSNLYKLSILTALLIAAPVVFAEDELELDTTFIKGNKELPQIMFMVPWQDMKTKRGKKAAQNLTLHSLFGDVFDPVQPYHLQSPNK
ncbi:MAG: hypothetical protein OEY52_08420 [Gammaproteobacteria bacterium]|nr:hypothetical protein [Gammaproteobacteria bacterium]